MRKHGVLIAAKSFEEPSFSRAARQAVFCLVPDGHWPSTQRLPSVISKGCVPVVVSNRLELPWNDLVNWDEASLWLWEEQIRELPQVLREVSPERVRRMQSHLPQLAEALDYHSTRFHVLLLASLAARRPSS
eukprot:TRINITY_DN46797_c0_g1_i1.p1 TRINITY_DN46797_c0_g1~~TRINITY_DN46797_c0_g1_i1.p1  ORF type:complete len:145 (-),score=32.06 TRINITY_DN46797_c0_g1_i1:24-419(-)